MFGLFRKTPLEEINIIVDSNSGLSSYSILSKFVRKTFSEIYLEYISDEENLIKDIEDFDKLIKEAREFMWDDGSSGTLYANIKSKAHKSDLGLAVKREMKKSGRAMARKVDVDAVFDEALYKELHESSKWFFQEVPEYMVEFKTPDNRVDSQCYNMYINKIISEHKLNVTPPWDAQFLESFEVVRDFIFEVIQRRISYRIFNGMKEN